jgi:hypothetical protein
MTSDDRSTEIDATVVEPAQDAVTDASPTVEPQPASAPAASAPYPPAPAASAPYPPAPAASAPYPPASAGTGTAPARPPVRIGTIVWGLVIAAIGVLVLALAAGATIDSGLAVIGLLAGSGVALLIGALVSAARRRETR